MHSKEIEITCKDGLHMRPAARFVQKAKEFQANIVVICGNLQANAKSLFKLQTLSLEKGTKIIIQADGADEQEAVATLATLIAEVE